MAGAAAKTGWADYCRALKALPGTPLRPFYLLFGPSSLLQREFLAALRARAGADDDMSFNRVPDAAEAPAAGAVLQARTPPFLGGTRVVVFPGDRVFGPAGGGAGGGAGAPSAGGADGEAGDAVAGPAGGAGGRRKAAGGRGGGGGGGAAAGGAAEESALVEYLAEPPAFSCLVAVCAEVDRRRRALRAAEAAGAVMVPCAGPTGEALTRWAGDYVRRLGKAIDAGTSALLIGRVGEDIDVLVQELDKLAAYAGDRPAIGAADVAAVASGRPLERVFVLLDDMGDRRPDRALGHLAMLLRQGENPMRIIALIAGHVRVLCRARAALDRGLAPFGAEQELRGAGVHPYVAARAVRQAARFQARELEDLVVQLFGADAAIKKGQLKDTLALELFLLGAGHVGRAAGAPAWVAGGG